MVRYINTFDVGNTIFEHKMLHHKDTTQTMHPNQMLHLKKYVYQWLI